MLKLKLRGKTLMVMLLVAVVPLLFSMIFLSNFSNDQIRTSMMRFAEKSSNFVARSTSSAQQELSNYLKLLSNSSDIVNALYYASLTGDIDQLREPIEADREQYGMDILEVLAAHNWNRNATADSLGINRTTLYKKMKKLGLEAVGRR